MNNLETFLEAYRLIKSLTDTCRDGELAFKILMLKQSADKVFEDILLSGALKGYISLAKPSPSVSLGAKREGRRKLAKRLCIIFILKADIGLYMSLFILFKYFVFDFQSNRYFALSGVHGADFAKHFAPCDHWIKIPFFLYYSPAFCGFKLDKLR